MGSDDRWGIAALEQLNVRVNKPSALRPWPTRTLRESCETTETAYTSYEASLRPRLNCGKRVEWVKNSIEHMIANSHHVMVSTASAIGPQFGVISRPFLCIFMRFYRWMWV
jgi:hypothetical protein